MFTAKLKLIRSSVLICVNKHGNKLILTLLQLHTVTVHSHCTQSLCSLHTLAVLFKKYEKCIIMCYRSHSMY